MESIGGRNPGVAAIARAGVSRKWNLGWNFRRRSERCLYPQNADRRGAGRQGERHPAGFDEVAGKGAWPLLRMGGLMIPGELFIKDGEIELKCPPQDRD